MSGLKYYYTIGKMASFTPITFTSSSFTTSIDLQESVAVSLKNYVKSKWPTNALVTADRIKFGNKNFDNFGAYQIHFIEKSVTEAPITTTCNINEFFVTVSCNVFVRKNSLSRPPEFESIKNSLVNIIQSDPLGFPITARGDNYIRIITMSDRERRRHYETLWHAIIEVEVRLWKSTIT
jgi:hypothetical protein